MSFFNRFFKNNKFPQENNDGTIQIIDNKLICKGNHGINSCEVNLDNLQYAYIIINRNKVPYLFLFDFHQNSIPTNFKGFKNAYEQLSKRFNFNDAVFLENVNKKMELKKEIWRKQYESTYAIIEGREYKDYENGFEIHSPQKQFISWETTYEELEKNENTIFKESPYKQKILKFIYPIRIGNILLFDFSIYFDNKRTDVPVLHFYTHCFDKLGTDKSYNDLKNILKNDIKLSDHSGGYERNDQKNIGFNLNGMKLSICYTYDGDWHYNGGYTSLSIENHRDYPNFLIDSDYENKMIVSNYLILDGKIDISGDYKRNRKIKRRPKKLTEQFQSQTIIWIDDVNNKIGFSSNQFSQVYEKEEIKSFCIQNILPAKGSGGGNLEIILENQKYNFAVLTENCHFFDKYAEKIKELTNKELVFGEEYHDC